MAVIYNNIVQSETEPSTNVLWLKGNKLKYYYGGWKDLTGNSKKAFVKMNPQLTIKYFTGELGSEGIDISELKTAKSLFYMCSNTTQAPEIRFGSHHDSLEKAFYQCTNLKTVYLDLDNSNITSLYYTFYKCENLQDDIFNKINFNKIQNFEYAFCECNSFQDVYLKSESAKNLNYAFTNCTSLKKIILDCPNVESMNGVIKKCNQLEEVYFNNTEKVTSLTRDSLYCSNLRKIVNLDIGGFSEFNSTILVDINNNIEYMVLLNLGKNEQCTSYDLYYFKNWGKGSEENRQSLVDTLITYSFDRKAAGYPTATIRFPFNYVYDNTWLTKEERDIIKSKGYSLI